MKQLASKLSKMPVSAAERYRRKLETTYTRESIQALHTAESNLRYATDETCVRGYTAQERRRMASGNFRSAFASRASRNR